MYSSLPHFTALIMCENVYFRILDYILEDTCRLIEFTVIPFYLFLVLKCIKKECNLDFKYSSICYNHLFNFRPQEFLRNFCVIDMWWSAQRDGVHSFSQSYALICAAVLQKFTKSWWDFSLNYTSGLYMADSTKPAGKMF